MLFAATYPQRTESVVKFGAHPTTLADDDYPWGVRPGEFDELLPLLRDGYEEDRADMFLRMLVPDADAAAAALALTADSAGGIANLSTVVLITPEEVDEAAKRHPDYRPPGS